MPQRAQRQPAPVNNVTLVVSLCNQLDAAIELTDATYTDGNLTTSQLKLFAESLFKWRNVVPMQSKGILSSADIQVLVSHAWAQSRNCCALVQLLVVILQQVATALGAAHGPSASGSARPRLSSRDADYHRTCLMALVNMMTCLSELDVPVFACWAQVASLLLRTHIPHALSRVLAALTEALHDDEHSSTWCLLMLPLLTCAECFMGLGIRAEADPLRFGNTRASDSSKTTTTISSRNTHTTDSTTSPSTTSTIPPSGKPVLIGPAVLWALADSSLAEHCCRAALLGFEKGRNPDVLRSASNFLTQLGNLACRLQLGAPQSDRASLAARDAVLSGPCLQYLLTADVLSQLHHVEGGGPLYGMPVRHLLPPKQQYRDITDVLYAQTLVCTVVPGPMRTHGELRHSTLAAARACFRYLRFVVGMAKPPGELDAERATAPFLALNVTRQALELMQVMGLGPADPTISSHIILGGQRGTAAARTGGSSSSGDSGGEASGARATGGGVTGAGEPQPWVPGRRLGLRLLEEWWGSGLPLVRRLLDLDLSPPAGVEVCSRVGKQGGTLALLARLAKTLTLKATALDEVPEGVPWGPCASPNVAAALSAGYLPCLERLMRAAQRRADTGDSAWTEVLLQPLTRSGVLAQLLAYGDVRQTAALVLTVGKLLGRMGGGGGGPSAARETLTWLLWRLVACLTHPDVALLWERGTTQQQREGHWVRQQIGVHGKQGPGDGEEGGGGEGQQQDKQRELELGQEGTAQGHSCASSSGCSSSTGSSCAGGSSESSATAGSAVAWLLPLPPPPPPLPAPTRQGLSLMSLALARWTTACLNARSWEERPADAHTRATSALATAVAADTAEAAIVKAWDAATLSDALGVLLPMRLMLCAASVAQAREDTRAVGSWRRVLVRDMGLPCVLAPVLEALAAVGKEEAAARGVDVVGEVEQVAVWLSLALPGAWAAAISSPGPGEGPSRVQAAVWAVCSAHGGHGGQGGGGVAEEGMRGLLGRVRLCDWEGEGATEEAVQWMREVALADGALLRAAALLPPPCEAVQGMQLCGNPWCDSLGGDSEDGRPLQRCGGCRAVAYCCRECQAEHWKEGGHKEECKGKRA